MPRFDTLTQIHKAIRAMVYQTGGDLQRTDFTREDRAAGAGTELDPVLHLLREHHQTEEVYLYPQLQPLEGELVEQMLAQHADVQRLLDVAGEARRQLDVDEPKARVAAGEDLNRRFNELVASYLEHLAQEEDKVLPATWKHFDDAALIAIQGRIIAEMDPGDLFQWLRWMFKGLNRMELTAILAGARHSMPEPAIDAVRALGAESLEPAEWEAVRAGAGL